MKKAYNSPTIRSEHFEIGVFGCYQGSGGWWCATGLSTFLASWGMCCKSDPDWWGGWPSPFK